MKTHKVRYPPPNVVTYNGEVVTSDGEPVTYDGPPLVRTGARLTVTAHPIDDETRRSLRGEDWNLEGQAEDWNQPGRAEDWNNTTLRRTDNPPPGEAIVPDNVDAVASSGTVDADAVNQYAINGPAFAGTAFVGDAFAVEGGNGRAGDTSATNFADANFSNFTFAGSERPANVDPLETLRRDVLARMDVIEAIVRQNVIVASNRGHNHPPELLEIERTDGGGVSQEIATAISISRREATNPVPDAIAIATQEALFRRLARYFAVGTLWVTASAVAGIIGQEAGIAYTANKQDIIDAFASAADSLASLLQHLPTVL